MARARSDSGSESGRSRIRQNLEPASLVSAPATIGSRLADLGLIVAFLALAFLLGCFPLKDTDFWWHLRTGDLIRQGAGFPVEDWYTFGAEGHEWINLHWLFEVLLSLGYEAWGVIGLNLAKCVITSAALLLLITARRPEWPVWVMVLAWLPALFLLGGRMYVRPETLTLLYLAAFLAILSRWDQAPRLTFALPVVQALWVNTQGLFVFGPFLLGCAWVDAALRPGAFDSSRRGWWRTVGIASAATLAICLLNPYGLLGALYPLQLARTMANPIFSRSIGELMPVLSLTPGDDYSFIAEMGIRNLPLQFHLATLILGALSFLLPILWRGVVRLRPLPRVEVPPTKGKGRRKGRTSDPDSSGTTQAWPLRPFRVLLFVAFSLLSFKATRNSHQFAAVVGAITAWNFGEWAAALRRRSLMRNPDRHGSQVKPRLLAFGALSLAFGLVASGQLYAWAGEGRTIGLGEEPLWYPHDAMRFAGGDGTPDRFVCIHNGHSALYEYYHGPERKTFTDARLEVMGPELYARYLELNEAIQTDRSGWAEQLRRMGNPGVLVDNVLSANAGVSATLLAEPGWRCVWFDPIAAVFVHETYPASRNAVDFGTRHYRPDPGTGPVTYDALIASADALYDVAFALAGRGRMDLARPMILHGMEQARRARKIDPSSKLSWKLGGLLESTRGSVGAPDEPVARYRMPFDPVFDLGPARATYLLSQALKRAPEDSKVLLALALEFHARGMFEAAKPIDETIARLDPPNQRLASTRMAQEMAIALAARATVELGPTPPSSWRNLAELEQLVDTALRTGRARTAADLLERAYPSEARPWEITDRIATLRLHLGEPEQARTLWQAALGSAPRSAVVAARIGATYFVEEEFDLARTSYQRALSQEPELFETLYGLALVEQDSGRAAEAFQSARRAQHGAPNEVAASAARMIADQAAGYIEPASSPVGFEARQRDTENSGRPGSRDPGNRAQGRSLPRSGDTRAHPINAFSSSIALGIASKGSAEPSYSSAT